MADRNVGTKPFDRSSRALGAVSELREGVAEVADSIRKRTSSILSATDSLVMSKFSKFLPAAAFAISMAATGALWKHESDASLREYAEAQASFAKEVEGRIAERMRAYSGILAGARGLFSANREVSPKDFRNYVESLEFAKRFPEIRGIAFSPYVPGDRIEETVASVRNRGFSTFGESFGRGSPDYAPITMIEPLVADTAPFIGTDGFSVPERKRAMLESADANDVRMSMVLRIPQTPDSEVSERPGFVLFLPVFHSASNAGTSRVETSPEPAKPAGWLATSFYVEAFVHEAMGSAEFDFSFDLYDGTEARPESLLHAFRVPGQSSESGIVTVRHVTSFGRDWTVVVHGNAEDAAIAWRLRPRNVFVLGAVSATLIAFLVWFLIRSHGNVLAALNVLEKTSGELRESEKRYRALFEHSKIPMLIVDPVEETVVEANPEAAKYYGRPLDEFPWLPSSEVEMPGIRLSERWGDRFSDLRFERGDGWSYETRHKLADGSVRDVEVTISTIVQDGRSRVLKVVQDVTERNASIDKVLEIATTDPLTGLPNRRLFSDRLNRAVETARRSGWSVTVIFVDLDRFKAVNDEFGHEAGDSLLREVAHRMRDCVRSEDTVARIGGDEFVVLLPRSGDRAGIAEVAGKLVESVSRGYDLPEGHADIWASAGIAIFPNDATDAEDLLACGDAAMYRVKQDGRGSYRFFSDLLRSRGSEP